MSTHTPQYRTNLQTMHKVLVFCAIFFSLPILGHAQFNPKSHADQVKTKTDTTAVIKAPPPVANLQFQLYSDAYDKYLKKLMFKRRNVVASTYDLRLDQASFNNWAAGGDNSFAITAASNIKHTYTAEVFSIQTTFDGKYGLVSSNELLQKNIDYFNITTAPSWNMSKHWKLTGLLIWKTQFSNSFTYPRPDSSVLVSGFMSPGTFDISVGFTYVTKNNKLSLYISPIAGKLTMVLNPELANKGGFGIDYKNKSQFFKADIGAIMRLVYSSPFAKKKMSYDTKFESFWNYQYAPSSTWENTITLKISNIFTAKAYVKLQYNDQVLTPRVKDIIAETPKGTEPRINKWNYLQLNQTVGIGLTFNLNSKPKDPIKESTITKSRLKFNK